MTANYLILQETGFWRDLKGLAQITDIAYPSPLVVKYQLDVQEP